MLPKCVTDSHLCCSELQYGHQTCYSCICAAFPLPLHFFFTGSSNLLTMTLWTIVWSHQVVQQNALTTLVNLEHAPPPRYEGLLRWQQIVGNPQNCWYITLLTRTEKEIKVIQALIQLIHLWWKTSFSRVVLTYFQSIRS